MTDIEWPDSAVSSAIQKCVEACDAVIRVSEDCADACMELGGDGDVTRCFLADLDCIEVCTATIRLLSWHTHHDSPTAVALLEACRAACTVSTFACERMAELHESWQTCSMPCRRLTEACTRLLAML